MKNIKLISINILLFLFLVEIASFGFVNFKNISTKPTYKFQLRNHYGDYNKYFGAWHKPNSTFNHQKSCFNVNYSFNSYGARDNERKKKSINKNRVIVLGDSVVEGYGLSDEERISNILEKKTNIPHLNFGTSGHFGTTQYYLNYKYLSSGFTHNKVFVFFTITNDFEDDSYATGKNLHKNRYRPYMIFDEDLNKYKLIYFDKKNFNNKKFLEELRNILSNSTYFYHALRYYYSILKSKNNPVANITSNNDIKSYLYNYDDKILSIIQNNLINIKILAKENSAELYLITVGHKREHNQYLNYKEYPKLIETLNKFSNENNINFIDAFTPLKISNENLNDYFFKCDSHHNFRGNVLIADYIYDKIYK